MCTTPITGSLTRTVVESIPSAMPRSSTLSLCEASTTSMTTGAGRSVSLGEVVPVQSLCIETRAMSETAINASALRCACSGRILIFARTHFCWHVS